MNESLTSHGFLQWSSQTLTRPGILSTSTRHQAQVLQPLKYRKKLIGYEIVDQIMGDTNWYSNEVLVKVTKRYYSYHPGMAPDVGVARGQ